MSLWVDKHRPKSLAELTYHKEQATKLQRLVESDDFPHLLIYGPSGAGKKTRIGCILRHLYGIGAEKLRLERKTFTTATNKRIEITSVSSNYHIEINPSDAGIYDRFVVQEMIKLMAQTQQLESASQKEFKVVVLTEVDRLSRDAQQALRRTMEKYTATCRLILCCRSISKVSAPLRSRCLGIRIASPSAEQIADGLRLVCKKEQVTIADELAKRIAAKANGNMRRALLICETCRVQQGKTMSADAPIPDTEWEMYVKATADLILQVQSPEQLLKVRERLYELLSKCIPPSLIFEVCCYPFSRVPSGSRLLIHLTSACDPTLKPTIVSIAAEYEHRLQKGSKAIFHLEAFIANFMNIYKKFVEKLSSINF